MDADLTFFFFKHEISNLVDGTQGHDDTVIRLAPIVLQVADENLLVTVTLASTTGSTYQGIGRIEIYDCGSIMLYVRQKMTPWT